MAGKVDVIVGVVDRVGTGVGHANAGTSLVDQFNTDKTGFSLVSQSLQTGATVTASVTSIVALTQGMVPFLSIPTNMLAGTVTFLKISADYKRDEEFQLGDVLSLVGNVVGVAAGFTLLAVGSSLTASLFIAAGAAVGLIGVFSSGAVKDLYNNLAGPVIERYLKNAHDSAYSGHWLAPDLQLVPFDMITGVYSGKVAAVHWSSANDSVTVSSSEFAIAPAPKPVPKPKPAPAPAPIPVPSPSPGAGAGQAVTYGGGGTRPIVVPLPEGPIARIDIGPLESPTARQDSYGCISSTQDGYH